MENKKNIGAFWLKTSKAGNKFMSGNIEIKGEKHEIVVFENTHKTQENQPDYKIYLSEKKKESKPNAAINDYADIKEEGIPF